MTVRVGLSRCRPDYAGLTPPYHPGEPYPEWGKRFGALPSPLRANHVYAAVRGALRNLGLDLDRFGTPDWNPLGDLVAPGGTVALKPNFIRHWNPNGASTVESVVTHGAVLRAVADFAWVAVGPSGRVTLAEAPQQDCDFSAIRRLFGLDAMAEFYASRVGTPLGIVDIRREEVVFKDGIIVSRRPLPGDPAGYRAVDLGASSLFAVPGRDPSLFRGADYDPVTTTDHHSGGRHEYLLSETVLQADLVVNLPKLKTHKKTGVTLALKNLVGINGDKNWLPHHSVGSPEAGGDEYPQSRLIDDLRSSATEWARALLSRGLGTGLFRALRRAEKAVRGDAFIRSGNWHGNDTTWRMCVDLNRCLYYSDKHRLRLDAPAPVREVLTVIDGVIAGDGEGPLAPDHVPLGAVLAATDPVALDLAAVRLMGFFEGAIPKIMEPMREERLRITSVRSPEEVLVFDGVPEGPAPSPTPLNGLSSPRRFKPHFGWVGHIEERARG